MTDYLSQIVSKFNLPQEKIKSIMPFGNGHINDTYIVSFIEEEHPGFILQRKNHHVFKNIPGMMENISRVTKHIRKKLENQKIKDIERKVITHLKSNDGRYFHQDTKSNYWTVYQLIEGCKNYEKIENTELAYYAGKAFGEFQKQLSDLPGKELVEIIPNFHNIEFRLKKFEKARKINFRNRIGEAKAEIDFAISLADEMKILLKTQGEGKIPLRVTHNDTKINNILFDENNKNLCVIDLDTVMPGLVHYDFGDAIRTAANTAEEDEKDLSAININLKIFEAFSRGFLKELKKILSVEEKELLAHSAKFMAYIMGLRFLTDFLEGDTYYKIKHPSHNIERARAQFKLVLEMGNNMNSMQKIISLNS